MLSTYFIFTFFFRKVLYKSIPNVLFNVACIWILTLMPLWCLSFFLPLAHTKTNNNDLWWLGVSVRTRETSDVAECSIVKYLGQALWKENLFSSEHFALLSFTAFIFHSLRELLEKFKSCYVFMLDNLFWNYSYFIKFFSLPMLF